MWSEIRILRTGENENGEIIGQQHRDGRRRLADTDAEFLDSEMDDTRYITFGVSVYLLHLHDSRVVDQDGLRWFLWMITPLTRQQEMSRVGIAFREAWTTIGTKGAFTKRSGYQGFLSMDVFLFPLR